MLSSTLRWLLPTTNFNRNISTSPVRFDDGKRLAGNTHKVNNFEKRLFIWMGKYKTIDEIPTYVTPESIQKVRSKMRIRVSNIFMVLTLGACIAMVYSGKKAHERGESVQQYNLEWHRKYKEEEDAKEKAESAKQSQ